MSGNLGCFDFSQMPCRSFTSMTAKLKVSRQAWHLGLINASLHVIYGTSLIPNVSNVNRT